MVPLKQFSEFPPPPPDTTIWRYTPARWFLPQVRDRILTFSRLDRFDDEHEGWLSVEIVEASLEQIKNTLGQDQRDIWAHVFTTGGNEGRCAHAASCWFIQDNETAMMWERYGRGGVAMRSTVGDVAAALSDPDGLEVLFGEIHYGDWPNAGYSNTVACFWKDPRYRDEREFRALLHKPLSPGNAVGVLEIDEYISAPFDLQRAIHEIVVCPTYCQNESAYDPIEEVRQSIQSAGLNIPVSKSTVGTRPDYSRIHVPPHFSR